MLNDRKTREEMIEILEDMAETHKPCEQTDFDLATEAEKQREFYNSSELYFQIKYLIEFMQKQNMYEDITNKNQ